MLPSIYPRTVLCKNNEIKTYNSFNEITETHNLYEADKIIINMGIEHTRRYKHYYIQNIFVFDGKEYIFSFNSFDKMENTEILEYMLRLKSDFVEKYVVKDAALVEELCRDKNFTAEEKALVYELFDYEE